MSREMIIIQLCDICRLEAAGDDDPRVPATTCYTIGIVQGESRPVPKVIDVCDDHAGPLADLLDLISEIHQLPGDAPNPTRRAPVKVTAANRSLDSTGHTTRECPICHRWLSSATLTSHVWKAHRGDPKPPIPSNCPECGEAYSGSGMSSHRRIAHGYDAVADALSGVPGYKPPKQPRELPAGQLELTGA